MQSAISTTTLLLLSILPVSIGAQTLLPTTSIHPSQEISLVLGLEPELATTVGYRKKLGSNNDHPITAGTSLKLAPLIIRNKAFKWSLFTQFTFSLDRKTDLLLLPQLFYARTADNAATISGMGVGIDATPFWKGKTWSKGILLSWQYTALAHIKHSEAAKETFRERYGTNSGKGPTDGWYHSTANRFRIGYTMARAISPHSSIQFGAGSLFHLQRQGVLFGFSHAQVPVFIEGCFRYQMDH